MKSENFVPLFGEHDGCILFRKMDATGEPIYRDWMVQLGGDRSRVEAMMNHHHIADILEGVVESPSHEVVLAFGRLLQELWTAKLSRDFPDRKFVVSFPEDYSDDVVDYEITFYQAA